MTGLKPLIGLVLLSLSGLVIGGNDRELKAVIVLFRHGDRAPLSSWPNDKYYGDSSLWPDGYGQLNNMGKERQYHLGQWFRNRYDGFLPSRYNSSDIYVRSTDVQRTLMSAASNLAGLYPPKGDQVWNKNILWQPIPIHTIPEELDRILAHKYKCPKYDRLLQQLKNSSEYQQLNQEYADVLHNVSLQAGFQEGQTDLDIFSKLFSTITIYKGYNLTLPEWTEQYWPEIKTLAAIHFKLPTYTQDLARLRTGPFFNFLIDHLQLIINQSDPAQITKPPKLLMLSAHDTTIADRTNAMGVYPEAVPEFASTVIWEVKGRKGSDTDLFVNLYFKNSTHFTPLSLPGCDFDCKIEDYLNIMKPISSTVEEMEEECFEK